jgi:hypothetical protein
MHHKFEPARLTLVLKAAQAHSLFSALLSAIATGRVLVGGSGILAPRVRRCGLRERSGASPSVRLDEPAADATTPFTCPEHMAVSEAATLVGRIARGLSTAVEVDSLSDEHFSVLLCASQILGVMWVTTNSWSSENLAELAELGLYFPESAWLCAAGITVPVDYRPLFRNYAASQLNRLFDPAVTQAAHGFELVRLLVVRRARSPGRERYLRATVAAMQNPALDAAH